MRHYQDLRFRNQETGFIAVILLLKPPNFIYKPGFCVSPDYFNLGIYSLLYSIGGIMEGWIANMSEEQQYFYRRWIEQWKYGSGGDYVD